jgi:ATP-dependent metalloprotease
MKNVQLGTDVDAALIARGTPGFSGAELENIVNQAAVHASKEKKNKVGMSDFEWAKDKVLMGAERKSAVIQEKDKIATAYHEGGHTLVALYTKGADPLYKATIMPRGHALGITFMLPDMDEVSRTKRQFEASLDVAMGGKAAEELIYGEDEVTSGASGDIQAATRTAYAMVTQNGMSDKLGNVDLASDFSRLSSETKRQIESEVRRLLDEAKVRAKNLLIAKRDELDLLAKALVEYENLNKEEIQKVVKGEKLPARLTSLHTAPIKLPGMMLPGAVKPPGSEGEDEPGAGVPGGSTPGVYTGSG